MEEVFVKFKFFRFHVEAGLVVVKNFGSFEILLMLFLKLVEFLLRRGYSNCSNVVSFESIWGPLKLDKFPDQSYHETGLSVSSWCSGANGRLGPCFENTTHPEVSWQRLCLASCTRGWWPLLGVRSPSARNHTSLTCIWILQLLWFEDFSELSEMVSNLFVGTDNVVDVAHHLLFVFCPFDYEFFIISFWKVPLAFYMLNCFPPPRRT